MVAVGATCTHTPRTVNIRDDRPMEVGSIIAKENMGAITIGICTAVNGSQRAQDAKERPPRTGQARRSRRLEKNPTNRQSEIVFANIVRAW